jgi:osmotically-inducible protein OsmY
MVIKQIKLICYMLIVVCCCSAKSITDKDIDTQINMLYEKNPILNEKKIHSTTKQQNVTLRGCVRNYEEKELAEDLAGLIDYIDSIDNKIKIKNSTEVRSKNSASLQHKISDTLISRLIHAKIMLNSSICGVNIHVKTLKGITVLTGVVALVEEKKRASEIAFKSRGVIDVINKLKVQPTS